MILIVTAHHRVVVVTSFFLWLAWLCVCPDPGGVTGRHLMLRLGLIGGFWILDESSEAVDGRGTGLSCRTGRELIRSSLWRDSLSVHG